MVSRSCAMKQEETSGSGDDEADCADAHARQLRTFHVRRLLHFRKFNSSRKFLATNFEVCSVEASSW